MQPRNPFEPSDAVSELVRQANKVRRLTRQEILNALPPSVLASMVDRIGGSMWVVVDSEGKTVLMDPALRQPFHTPNRKFAEVTAKEVRGVAMVFSEAIKVITERNKPND